MSQSVADTYKTVEYACNFNAIPNDEISRFAKRIEAGELSRWHYTWLIPSSILASALEIALAPIAFLANLIASAVFAIMACTSDENFAFNYKLCAHQALGAAFSAITDQIATSIVRIAKPEIEPYRCVYDSIAGSLIRQQYTNMFVSYAIQTLHTQHPNIEPYRYESTLRTRISELIRTQPDYRNIESIPPSEIERVSNDVIRQTLAVFNDNLQYFIDHMMQIFDRHYPTQSAEFRSEFERTTRNYLERLLVLYQPNDFVEARNNPSILFGPSDYNYEQALINTVPTLRGYLPPVLT